MRWFIMNNINKDNEKDISVNITHKSNFLLVSLSFLLVSLILIIFFLFEIFASLKLFLTIFSCILVGVLFISIFFASLTNFLTYHFRDNLNKLYKNNKVRTLFLILSYIFLWSYLGLSLIFLMVLLILN